MSNKKKIFYVVNYGMIYTASQLVMEWCGLVAYDALSTNYSRVIDDIDPFLHQNSDFEDTVVFIGFSAELEKKIRTIYKSYTGFKFINTTEESTPFHKALKMAAGAKHLTDPQKLFIKYVHDWATNAFKTKEGYILSVLFRSLSKDYFYKNFKNGYTDISRYGKTIQQHVTDFKTQNNTVYSFNGYYFVNGDVKFLDDIMYKFLNEFSNISLVDIDRKRVFMRKLHDSDTDLLGFCKEYCESGVGYAHICSGAIGKPFIVLTKSMEKVK
jgi:hypothetical protein